MRAAGKAGKGWRVQFRITVTDPDQIAGADVLAFGDVETEHVHVGDVIAALVSLDNHCVISDRIDLERVKGRVDYCPISDRVQTCAFRNTDVDPGMAAFCITVRRYGFRGTTPVLCDRQPV